MSRIHVNWQKVVYVTGLVGFVLQLLGFIADAAKYVLVLRAAGILLILLWAVWVTLSITNLQRSAVAGLPYGSRRMYFDGTNRSFFSELEFWNSNDTKPADLVGVPLATAFREGDWLKVQRHHNRCRWIVSVIKYLHTSRSSTDRFIPADHDPAVRGRPVRNIEVKFAARVENDPHQITVRLRGPKSVWLRRKDGSNEWAARSVRVSSTSWEEFDGVIGPVHADQPCYVSLDVMPGPKGDKQCLFIRDLQILEVRKQP